MDGFRNAQHLGWVRKAADPSRLPPCSGHLRRKVPILKLAPNAIVFCCFGYSSTFSTFRITFASSVIILESPNTPPGFRAVRKQASPDASGGEFAADIPIPAGPNEPTDRMNYALCVRLVSFRCVS